MNKENKKDNILRLDLDLHSKKKCITHLIERLYYLNHLKYLSIERIDKIILVKKKTYGCKIYLNKKCSVDYIFKAELILGDDWKKAVCSQINYYKYEMDYSRRLFEVKKYPDGKVRVAKLIDVTKDVRDYIINAVAVREKMHKEFMEMENGKV